MLLTWISGVNTRVYRYPAFRGVVRFTLSGGDGCGRVYTTKYEVLARGWTWKVQLPPCFASSFMIGCSVVYFTLRPDSSVIGRKVLTLQLF